MTTILKLIVMDNLSTHKNKGIVSQIENAGAKVLFTPPYFPEFNPIEKVWSKMKTFMRRMEPMTRENIDRAVANAMTTITQTDIRNWFCGAGYKL